VAADEWYAAHASLPIEKPGTGFITPDRRGKRPLYYAGFVNLGGQQFFACQTEIHDDARYKWTPDNDLAATAGRGVRQLRRALDSLALAALFTRETDHIHKICPDAGSNEIAEWSPVSPTTTPSMSPRTRE
jgi:hypothetical protein